MGGERPGQAPPLCPATQASLAHGCPLLLASAHFLYFVLPLGAERSAGFWILLLGVVLLVVICTAVTGVVMLARKVITLAAHLSRGHPTPATLALLDSFSAHREALM